MKKIIKCPDCWGKGKICIGLHEDLTPILKDCPTCKGSGLIIVSGDTKEDKMILKRAIKITEDYINFKETDPIPDRIPAFKMLIEAGKHFVYGRKQNIVAFKFLLPGETED